MSQTKHAIKNSLRNKNAQKPKSDNTSVDPETSKKGIVPQKAHNPWGKHRPVSKASSLYISFSSPNRSHGSCKQFVAPGKSLFRANLQISETETASCDMDTTTDNLTTPVKTIAQTASVHSSSQKNPDVINANLDLTPTGHHLNFQCKITTPEQGTEMGCGRFVETEIQQENQAPEKGMILLVSPNKRHHNKKAKRKLELTGTPLIFSLPPAAQSQNSQSSVPIKSGGDTEVKPYKKLRSCYLTQTEVMGTTAKEEVLKAITDLETQNNPKLESFILEQSKLLNIDSKSLSEKVLNNLKALAKKNLHWMHGESFGLTRRGKNPQIPSNLGCGPDFINYWQYAYEQCIAYFAKEYPGAKVSLKYNFFMLPGTEIVIEIHYEFSITLNSKTLNSKIKMPVLAESDRSNTASFSDTALLIATMTALLEDREPQMTTNLRFKP